MFPSGRSVGEQCRVAGFLFRAAARQGPGLVVTIALKPVAGNTLSDRLRAMPPPPEGTAQVLPPPAATPRLGLSPPPHPAPLPDAPTRLAALAARVRHDLDIMDYPRGDWVMPRTHPSGQHVWDVVIMGAGQGGLAAWFGLWRERIRNVLIVEQAPKGGEGPWATYSRMWTLRSPKHLTGPDLGIPSLAPRAWYEATFGAAAWDALEKWPRRIWQDYLDWYREVLEAPVRNDWRLDRIGWDAAHALLELDGTGGRLLARKVILANGIEGSGDWRCPDFMQPLPRDRWHLCTEDFDSAILRGKRVAVLGAGATAWDRAADVLEHGAASLTLTMRRPGVLEINPFRCLEKAGYLRHFPSMDDEARWRWMTVTFDFGTPPTQDGLNRCAIFPNFWLHAGATWTSVSQRADGLHITSSDGSTRVADHLLIGMGFETDLTLRPELRAFEKHIARWQDRYEPPPERAHAICGLYPYLNPDLSFVEREAGACPALASIHCFNYGAMVSNGFSGASLSGMKYGIEPLLWGITKTFWMADEPVHFAELANWTAIDTDASVLRGRYA
jgi:cation diffusion facilitator CzcD-associated flavoprotein CzcO